ncbi:MAG: response regulator, partial [Stellaceae bacterium]
RDAMPSGGRLTIRARNATVAAGVVADLDAGDYLLLSVSDTGIGIPAEIRQKVFEPFFTTKEAGKGSGLGLSMVYGFTRQSGGTVLIASVPGAGTTVTLHLPRALGEGVSQPTVAKRGSGDFDRDSTVLIVEDEEPVRRVAAEALEIAGYRVLLAGSGSEALAVLQEVGRVDLVVSDIVMPGGMNGGELARRIQESPYASPILLTTGYALKPDSAFVGVDRFEVLQKPFRPKELCAKVQELIAAGRSPRSTA